MTQKTVCSKYFRIYYLEPCCILNIFMTQKTLLYAVNGQHILQLNIKSIVNKVVKKLYNNKSLRNQPKIFIDM